MTPDYYVSLMKVYSRFVLNMNPAQRAKDQMLKIAVGPGTPDTEWTEAVMKAWKKAHLGVGHQRRFASLVHGS
jgi:alpha-N-arabinofuranosidase